MCHYLSHKSHSFRKSSHSCYICIKPRPNDRNIPKQHIATLLGATSCMRLATVLWCVATCWVLLARFWPFSNLSQQHPTCRNTSQHGGQTHATCCTHQCCDMLRWHVAIVWSGLNSRRSVFILFVSSLSKSNTLLSLSYEGYCWQFWTTEGIQKLHQLGPSPKMLH